MDILKDAASSITGSINKAMLFVKKNNTSNGISNSELRDKLLRGGLKSNPAKTLKEATSRAGSSKPDGYHVLQVKYNPSSIKYKSRSSNFAQSGPGGMGVNQITQSASPSETTMTVELVFDDVNIQDAFMWEKFGLTAGGAVSSVAGIAKQINKDGYSVQAQVEGLIALITQSEARSVVFYWSEMAFAGVVASVDATYTMFNPQGHPIRANVTLHIFQAGEEAVNKEMQYWNKAFNKLFGNYKMDNDVDDSRILDQIGNLLNI